MSSVLPLSSSCTLPASLQSSRSVVCWALLRTTTLYVFTDYYFIVSCLVTPLLVTRNIFLAALPYAAAAFQPFDAHCCRMGTTIKHPIPALG